MKIDFKNPELKKYVLIWGTVGTIGLTAYLTYKNFPKIKEYALKKFGKKKEDEEVSSKII